MNQLHQHIKSVEDCVNQALRQIGFRIKDNTPYFRGYKLLLIFIVIMTEFPENSGWLAQASPEQHSGGCCRAHTLP